MMVKQSSIDTTNDLNRMAKEVKFNLHRTQSEIYEDEDISFVASPMLAVMEDSEIISIDVLTSPGGLEESKTAQTIKKDNLPRFHQVFFPECGLKIVQEYNVLTQECRRHEINSPWAFPAGFAFCQTPNTNRLFITGGIGDDEQNRRCLEIKIAGGSFHRMGTNLTNGLQYADNGSVT